MGMLEDIRKLLRMGPEVASKLDNFKSYTNSIVKNVNDATWQFPCLVSDTIPIDMANTIVRMLDRKYAVYSQIIVSLNPIMDYTLNPTPMAYLNRLHQNMKLESVNTFTDSGEELERNVCEAYTGDSRLYLNKDKTFGIVFSGTDKVTREVMESHRSGLDEYMSEFDLRPITEALSDETNSLDIANSILDGRIKKMEREDRQQNIRTTDNYQTPKLLDRDIKKANDMIPFGLQVRLIAVNDKKEFVQYIDFVLGVKAVMHAVKSDEFIFNIQRAVQNKSVFFKFIKWTTGEISLFKDIILNLNEIKLDNRNVRPGESPYFIALRRLKKKKIGFRGLTVPHSIIPNATIVLSSYEADYLLNKMAIDVKDPTIAKHIMSSLFLVSIIVVDEGTGTIDIFEDGNDSYQTYALETLERENSLNSNKLGREIGRMIAH